jgi:hypothetical protein
MFTAATLSANERTKRVMTRLRMSLQSGYLHADAQLALLYILKSTASTSTSFINVE